MHEHQDNHQANSMRNPLQGNPKFDVIVDIFKADRNDPAALKKLGLDRRKILIIFTHLSISIAIQNEFKYANGQWNYQKQDYGPDFVPKANQVTHVKKYNPATMPQFENKEDLINIMKKVTQTSLPITPPKSCHVSLPKAKACPMNFLHDLLKKKKLSLGIPLPGTGNKQFLAVEKQEASFREACLTNWYKVLNTFQNWE